MRVRNLQGSGFVEQKVFVCAECTKDIDRVRIDMDSKGETTSIEPQPGFWAV